MSDPKQLDLFGGEQAIKPKHRDKPAQMEMFSAAQIGFGVNARPVADDVVTLALVSEDPRSDDQREADLLHQAESLTLRLPE